MFLPRLAPRFDVALRDVTAEKPEYRLDAVTTLSRAENGADRERAREAIRPLLDDAHARVRSAAIEALGHVGTDDDLPALRRRLRDKSSAIREIAVIAIARIGTELARETLRTLLHAEEPEVRYQAIEALGTLADHHSATAIAVLLDDSDRFVREASASALEALGANDHRDRLAAALEDVERPVRLAAALALASVGDLRAVPTLRAEVASGRPSLETLEAIARLGTDEAIPELRALLRRWFAVPSRLRLAVAATLAALGADDGVEFVRSRLRGFFLGPRLEALTMIGRLRLEVLAGDVAELAKHPRGIPRDVLAHALERLERARVARDALAALDRTSGER